MKQFWKRAWQNDDRSWNKELLLDDGHGIIHSWGRILKSTSRCSTTAWTGRAFLPEGTVLCPSRIMIRVLCSVVAKSQFHCHYTISALTSGRPNFKLKSVVQHNVPRWWRVGQLFRGISSGFEWYRQMSVTKWKFSALSQSVTTTKAVLHVWT